MENIETIFKAIENVLIHSNKLKTNLIKIEKIDLTNIYNHNLFNIDITTKIKERVLKNKYLIYLKQKIEKISDFNVNFNSIEGSYFIFPKYDDSFEKLINEYKLIKLELKEPEDSDWENRIKTIQINMNMVTPSFSNVELVINEDQAKNLIKEKGLQNFTFSLEGPTNEIFFYNSEENKISDFKSIMDPYVPSVKDLPTEIEKIETNIEHKFENESTFIKTEIGLLNVQALKFKITVYIRNNPITIEASQNKGFAIAFTIVDNLVKINGV